MKTRSRAIPVNGGCNATWIRTDTVSVPVVTKGSAPFLFRNNTGTQVTASESHPGWRRRKPGVAIGDVGGEFFTSKTTVTVKGGCCTGKGRAIIGGFLDRQTSYDGWVLPFVSMPAYPPDASSSNIHLGALGTKAINATKPTNALVDLATSLSELLRDRPTRVGTSLWQTGAGRARAAGDEYLNIEFGWKPLIDDVRKTMNAVSQIHTAFEQYKRDAGRLVRRRYDFPLDYSTETSDFLTNVNGRIATSDGALDPGPGGMGKVVRTRELRAQRWFKGAFTYALPYDMTNVNRVDEARHILGLDLTPEVLWNLAPWSWAVDWFVPIGDLIGNLEDIAADGLVLKYGYMMEHKISTDTYTFQGPTGLIPSLKPAQIIIRRETKKRTRSTPYGFGLTWDGFSNRQVAILTALGLSRS